MSKRAIITGITGQDGSYLAELLLDQGLRGHRRRAPFELAEPVAHRAHPRSHHAASRATCSDQLSLMRIVQDVRPHELYNLAAMSFVPASWDQPLLTGEFNSQGVTRVLEAIRQVDPSIRLYQASSSEMYGRVREVPQTELTPFYPRSPYGVSKVFAHYITVNYRESYGMFAVLGHSVQPRVAAARARVRDAQGHRRCCPYQDGPRRSSRRSAISMHVATGASPATTCARCG